MRTIKISEEAWHAIAERGKFGETEDDVLRRVFNIGEEESPRNEKENIFTLNELLKKDLNKTKPQCLYIGDETFEVNTWSNICVSFVQWLINQQFLSSSKIPIKSYAMGQKYFINNRESHAREHIDGKWKRVGDYFVDTKYNSINHVRNISAALKQLKIQDPGIRISVRFKTQA